jgi:hypothetical protein
VTAVTGETIEVVHSDAEVRKRCRLYYCGALKCCVVFDTACTDCVNLLDVVEHRADRMVYGC